MFGIVQYGILHYDNLGQRPQGTLGHYMTYSGLLMLVIGVALARVLFGKQRSDVGGARPAGARRRGRADLHAQRLGRRLRRGRRCCFALKDFRLFAILPIVAAIFIAVAPGQIAKRYQSMFDMNDPTGRDRVAMLHERRADDPRRTR